MNTDFISDTLRLALYYKKRGDSDADVAAFVVRDVLHHVTAKGWQDIDQAFADRGEAQSRHGLETAKQRLKYQAELQARQELEASKDWEDLSTEEIMDRWDETFAKDAQMVIQREGYSRVHGYANAESEFAFIARCRAEGSIQKVLRNVLDDVTAAIVIPYSKTPLEPLRMLIDDEYSPKDFETVVKKLNEVIERLNAQGGK